MTNSENKMYKDLDLENVMIRDIKCLAMQLSQYKPADWKEFLDVVVNAGAAEVFFEQGLHPKAKKRQNY